MVWILIIVMRSINIYVISDEEIVDDESGTYIGADIQIDALGNVDIGYNMHDPDEEAEMPDDTDTFKLDVKRNIFATKYGKSEETLTHMPLGSIIMWSGWTDELPEDGSYVWVLMMIVNIIQVSVIFLSILWLVLMCLEQV